MCCYELFGSEIHRIRKMFALLEHPLNGNVLHMPGVVLCLRQHPSDLLLGLLQEGRELAAHGFMQPTTLL